MGHCVRARMIVHAIHQKAKETKKQMAELSIDPDYLRRLVVKVRSFMGKEETDLPDDGSNPIDDEVPLGALQDEEDDLSREEVVEEIQGLTPRQQAELVALMWLGRGDGEPEEWNELLARAIERREVPTARPSPARRELARRHGAPWPWRPRRRRRLAGKGGKAQHRPSPFNYISSSSLAHDGR